MRTFRSSRLDFHLGFLIFLTFLILQIKCCPNVCRCIQAELRVDCSNSSLSNIPPGIPRNTKILILSDNSFTSLNPKELRNIGKNLEVLKLSNNRLSSLDGAWLRSLKKLRELDLSTNSVNKIELLAFNESSKLQILKLRNNQLSTLPDGSFWGLITLKKLILDDNQIEHVRLNWTFGLSSLQELSLKRNSIKNISIGSFGPMKRLNKLLLSDNQIQKLQGGIFDGLKELQVLRLGNNQVNFIDENIFHRLDSLETLDLSHNFLSWSFERTRGLFSKLPNLLKLRLNNNKIRLLRSNTFDGCEKVKELDLSSNPLTTIEPEVFTRLHDLEILNFNSTSLYCDCSIKPFVEWLRSTEVRENFAKTIHCSGPEMLRDKTRRSIFDASENDYDCQDRRRPVLMDNFKAFDKPLQAIKSKNIAFYCKVATSSEVKFSWIKDNELIEDFRNHPRIASRTSQVQRSGENSTLFTNILSLSNVESDDEGEYQCLASNRYGVVYSHPFRVNVFIGPQFVKRPSNVTAKIGSTVRWNCSAFGEPQPHVTWNKAGKFVAGDERRLRFDGDLFFIVNVTKEDAGIYTCSIMNEAGVNVSTVSLKVVQPATFVRHSPEVINAELDAPASLECIAVGLPMPTIQWFRNGTPLEKTNRHFFTHQDQFLLIVNLKKEDAGKYSCQAKNEYGFEEVEFDLKPIPKKVPENSISVKELNVYGFIKNHALIICIVVLVVLMTSIVWLTVFVCFHRQKKSRTRKRNIRNDNISSHGHHNNGADDNVQTPLGYGTPYEDYQSDSSRVSQGFSIKDS